ncbi:hypothetical protein Nepgr_013694 [Nepenthes gracilis]|uniref:Uncharacterized protein n=1 Tax=Nepenthes gracilis TaxID=150966 RepID=A0AAD3SIB1_NEPGR|nr:hypothetical protein Nepgr_013694 [Nepenthes gracilis]
MAYRYRSVSNPALSFLKSTIAQKPTPKPIPFRISPSSPSVPRTLYQLGSLQSLLPLYSAEFDISQKSFCLIILARSQCAAIRDSREKFSTDTVLEYPRTSSLIPAIFAP